MPQSRPTGAGLESGDGGAIGAPGRVSAGRVSIKSVGSQPTKGPESSDQPSSRRTMDRPGTTARFCGSVSGGAHAGWQPEDGGGGGRRFAVLIGLSDRSSQAFLYPLPPPPGAPPERRFSAAFPTAS